ncbi:MAG: hypothetical protein HJJLKODD_02207 [Phycisphaerae bacterium]|nr:hypothetical protein [Phycisphaerae bacterium]
MCSKFRSGILSSTMVVILLVSGCHNPTGSATQRIDQAASYYRLGRFAESNQLVTSVLQDGGPQGQQAEAHYLRALCQVRLENSPAAEFDLRRALNLTRDELLEGKVYAQLGHLALTREDFSAAADYYADAVKKLPNQPPKDEIYLRWGEALQKQGRWREARNILPKVWYEFPGGPYAQAARDKHDWPYEYFSIQCGTFGQLTNAQQLVEQLRPNRFNPALRQQRTGSNVRHVVYVGNYSNYLDATADLVRVRAVVADAFIVP